MDRRKVLGVLALAPLLGTGCRSSEPHEAAAAAAPASGPVTGAPAGRPIEMLSWWGPLGQSDPVKALIAEHAKRFPEDYVINARTLLSGRARSTLTARMMSGEPPDVFQCNVGYDMRQWVSMDGVDDRGSKLAPLDETFPSLWKAVPSKLLDYISFQGKLYGVPATVHRVNAMFYNKAVLAAHGIAPPASVADLHAAGRKLRAAGIPLLAIDGKEPWQFGHFVFEDLLVAREGVDFYRSYFGGAERPDDPRMVKTLEEALELLRYANADWQDLSFLEASDLVVQGKAAVSVGGDWMTVYYAPNGLKEDSPIGEAAFPGTEKTFVFTSDLFALPVRAKNPAGAKRFLSTVVSPEAQRVLSKVKGSISPRTDVNEEGATALQRQKADLLRRGDLALALSGMVPKSFHDDVNWALIEMVKHRNIQPALQALRGRYGLLLGGDAAK
jgi:glucose/mannose transport system substrate-binding protein